MQVIEYTKLRKVKVGDAILGYGIVTAVNGKTGDPCTLQTDTGYRWLSFPEGESVPVISKRLVVLR